MGFDFSLTVLGSGSAGNCSLIRFGETRLLIDSGFSGKETCQRMEQTGVAADSLDAILVSHEHSDHIQSVHTLSRRFEAPIYCTTGTFEVAIAQKKFFDWQQVSSGHSFMVGKMCIHPITLPHDAVDPIGFRIECEGKVLTHLTDFGYPSGLVRESLKGCDSILLEANHDLGMLRDGPYPWYLKQRIAARLGHLSNESFYEILPEILHEDMNHLVIAHMSSTNNDPRLVAFQTRRILRRMGLASLPFTIAKQDEPMESFQI